MIPVHPFYYPALCKIHGHNITHLISFISFDARTQIVTYLATCCECVEDHEEYEEEDDNIGFIGTVSATEWDKLTPQEDEVVLN